MKTKQIVSFLLIFFIALLLQFPLFWLRGGYISVLGLRGFPLAMMGFAIVYFIATVLLLKRYVKILPRWIIILAILAGASGLELYLKIFTYHKGLLASLDLTARVLAVIAGVWYTHTDRKTKKTLIVVGFGLICLWSSYFGFPLWLHKCNFGTFTGRVEQHVSEALNLRDSTLRSIPVSDFKGKYLILDFWSESCGTCIKALPEVERLYGQVKTQEGVAMYSVFCMQTKEGENLQSGSEIMKREGCVIPLLNIDMDAPELELLKVEAFPTTLILAPDGAIIFRGNLKSAERLLRKDRIISVN